jgi:hypothetical protein
MEDGHFVRIRSMRTYIMRASLVRLVRVSTIPYTITDRYRGQETDRETDLIKFKFKFKFKPREHFR